MIKKELEDFLRKKAQLMGVSYDYVRSSYLDFKARCDFLCGLSAKEAGEKMKAIMEELNK